MTIIESMFFSPFGDAVFVQMAAEQYLSYLDNTSAHEPVLSSLMMWNHLVTLIALHLQINKNIASLLVGLYLSAAFDAWNFAGSVEVYNG